jgi:hypothetical protein
VGYGWLAAVRRGADWLAYPVGLIVCVLASWLTLLTLWLAPIALLLVAPAVLGIRRTVSPALRAAPFAAGLGLLLGSLLHGPTADESSHAYTDLLVYAAKLASARESVAPFRDLLVAGESNTSVEAGSTFLGASLPFVDPILFQAATMPAFLVTSLALGFAWRRVRVADRDLLALAPLAVAVVAYPTWITESPPVALALPLAFALYALARDRLELGEVAIGVVVIGFAFALTKGFGVIELGVATCFAAAGLRGRVDVRRAVIYAAPIVLTAAVAFAFFAVTSGWLTDIIDFKFMPADAVDGLRDQLDRRDTQAAAPSLLLIGEILLVAAFSRARATVPLAFLVAAVLGNWFVGGHSYDITIGLAVVIALLALSERPAILRAQLPLVVASGVALALSAMFRDISGLRAGVVFCAVLGAGVLAALAASRRAYALVAVAAALVAIAVGGGGLTDGTPTLTPQHYDIWREVRARVPRSGIVFTSETGPAINNNEGWNYYPGVARRQVYLAGWSSSPLLVDPDERARRLRLNSDVVEGRRDPRTVEPGRSSYFLVVRREAPARGRLVHANDTFALYEIP